MLALAAREMQEWLSGSPERVVALHCKGTYFFFPLLRSMADAAKLERAGLEPWLAPTFCCCGQIQLRLATLVQRAMRI